MRDAFTGLAMILLALCYHEAWKVVVWLLKREGKLVMNLLSCSVVICWKGRYKWQKIVSR
jgi:hypothetical protein